MYAVDKRIGERFPLSNRGNQMIVEELWRVVTDILKFQRLASAGHRGILDIGLSPVTLQALGHWVRSLELASWRCNQ